MSRKLKDALLVKSFTMPPAASATVTSAILDLGASGFKPEGVEANIVVPALTTTMAPDTRTVRVIIETAADSAIATVDQTLYDETFAGAGGVGIAAKSKLVRLPSNCARYIRARIVFGASTTDASTLSATFQLLF